MIYTVISGLMLTEVYLSLGRIAERFDTVRSKYFSDFH